MQPPRAFLWHGLALAWFAFVVSKVCRAGLTGGANPVPGIAAYGGAWKFLTFLNLVLQAILCGVSLLADVLMLMKKWGSAKAVVPFRDVIFGALGFPLCMFVFTCFWVIYLYDRNLIYPKSLDAVIPEWLNQAMHTSIFPYALIELFCVPRRYPSKGKRFTLLGISGIAYLIWVLHIYQKTGIWVYPFFQALNPLGLLAFFLGAIGICIVYSNMGAFLYRMIWGENVVVFDKKKCQ